MTSSPLAGRRVLLIEDEMMVVMLLQDMLIDLGCTVLGHATCVEQALAMIENTRQINAALLDVNLNGQRSYPVAVALVERGVPFSFVTGYRGNSMMNWYRRFPVLHKPFRLSQLRGTLTSVLSPNEVKHFARIVGLGKRTSAVSTEREFRRSRLPLE